MANYVTLLYIGPSAVFQQILEKGNEYERTNYL